MIVSKFQKNVNRISLAVLSMICYTYPCFQSNPLLDDQPNFLSLGLGMLVRIICLRISLLTLVFLSFSSGRTSAFIDLSILHPTTDFSTNNQILQIDGVVKSSIPEIIVSTNTPSGVIVSTNFPADGRDSTQLVHSIYSMVVDVGSPQQLKGMLIRPVIDSEFSFGPRRIRVSFSQENSNFQESQVFNVPSSLHPGFHRMVVDFLSPVTAQFIQIDMLEGWQRRGIIIQSIEFLDASDRTIPASVQDVSILVNFTQQDSAFFSIEMLLKEGKNPISLFARPLSPTLAALPENQAVESISPIFLSVLRPEVADEGRFILSDGSQAKIIIPASAFEEDIKKLQFFSIPPADVPPLSYLTNTRIAKATSPVVVYRFQALKQGRFAVEATSSLSNQPPTLAVDGILEPPSTWMAGLVPLPIHLTIDLGDRRTVSRIDVHANVIDEQSFGPGRANILISNDNVNFTEILEFSDFGDGLTSIELPTRPTARYIRLEITEDKQVNNVQLNEVELFDASGAKIVPFVALDQFVFEQPLFLELSYTESDLISAGVSQEADLQIFAWAPSSQEWQLAGGQIDLNRQTVGLELNYITQFALFQAVPELELRALWSFNPFSPDGNGIADTTRLTIVNPDTLQTGSLELVVEIYDLHNKLIRTLINRTVINSNSISVEWDGRDRTGRIVNIGPYIYQILLGSQVQNGVIVVGK